MSPDPGLPGAAPLELPSTEVTALSSGLGPATITHLVSLVGAFAFWAWLDRGLWFFGDEWDFLVQRGLGSAPTSHHSIWFPHNEHWSTLPILLWRGLFGVFHLGTYWPYLLPVLLAQVAIMHLAWRQCRRAGADPWISTAAVILLGFLGAGAEDLAWAFQLGFVGSVLFGLLAIDLLDRRGAGNNSAVVTERSVVLTERSVVLTERSVVLTERSVVVTKRSVGLVAASLMAALMCSTVGDAMVVGAAVLAFSRWPRKQAALAIGPPVALYLVWFAFVGHLGLAEHSDRFPLSTFTDVPAYVWTGLSSALGQTFNLEAAGAALLIGLAAWTGWQMRGLWAGQPALVALVAAVIAFYALAALGRDASTVSPTVSRYIYVAMALLVPVLAKLLSSVVTGPVARLAAVALLIFTALGNVGQAQTWEHARQALTSEVKTQLAATGQLLADGLQDVSGPSAAPVSFSPNLSVGTIARLGHSHLLPTVPLTAQDLVNARAVLALGVWNGLDMTLTPTPLSSGRFRLVKVEYGVASAEKGGCMALSPQAVSQNMQLWLSVTPGAKSASAQLAATPASPGAINYVAVFLVPPQPPSSSAAVELTVPTVGTGYVNDNYPGAQLLLVWTEGTQLTVCGLATRP
jgi:hypothetical protein